MLALTVVPYRLENLRTSHAKRSCGKLLEAVEEPACQGPNGLLSPGETIPALAGASHAVYGHPCHNPAAGHWDVPSHLLILPEEAYEGSRGVARYNATWKVYQAELALEEIFHGQSLQS